MAQYQNQYSAAQTDESDNLRRTDEYGNPIHNTGTTGIGGGHNTGLRTAGDQQQMERHDLGGNLQRSGSGSSSSDEDDEQGGRRKKGLKERLPGHKAQDDQCLGQGQGQGRRTTAAPTQGMGYGATNTQGIRAQDDCLGQGQGQGQGRRPTVAPTQGLGYGATNTQGVGGTAKPDSYDEASQQEKKGMMEKIKEKLPGGHNK